MKRALTIDDTRIADDTDCYVVAEVGHNHQGSVDKARALFKAAKECGANAVKLQKRDNRALYTRAMYDKPYENENSFGATYGEHREALEFGHDEYAELKSYAAELGITMFATAFDFTSVDFLAELDMPAYKVASGDLKNVQLLRHIAGVGKPMLVSTGGGTMDDVRRAVDVIMPVNRQLCVLQCTASYPTAAEEMNLRVIETLRSEYPELVIGFSDHYNGIAMSIVAFILGARVVEKHFTLNHTWKGTDHAMSLEPIGMHKMIRDLQRARLAMGDGEKRTLPCEESALAKMGKSIVAARDLPAGHLLTAADLAFKSPGGGLPPYAADTLLGRRLLVSLEVDTPISNELLQRWERKVVAARAAR